MNLLRIAPNAPEAELLLSAERDLVPEPDDVRDRVVERARALLQVEPSLVPARRLPRSRRLRVGLAAAAAVMLFALCSVAFLAGYRLHAQGPGVARPETASRPSAPPQIPPPPPPAPPEGLPTSKATASPDPVPSVSGFPKTKPGKPVTDVESYGMERRILQPAQQAISRQEFRDALSAIAEHQHRFPSGQLAEEREAMRVKALLGLGRAHEAERAAAAFRERFPRSALVGRIDEMVGTAR